MKLNNIHLKQNIPVNSSFANKTKEIVHNFFRRPMIVKILTYLPSIYPFKRYKELAQLITKCHERFGTFSQSEIKIYGGDKLSTLRKLEKSLPLPKLETLEDPNFETTIEFSSSNSLEAAREIRDRENTTKKIAILNLGNRRQPGGVGLDPYGGSQEEFLVRRSNLAWGLDPRFKSERVHEKLRKTRKRENLSGSFEHHIPYFGTVVSRNITFIDKEEEDQFDIISAAAPDMRKGSDEYRFLHSHFKDVKKVQLQILEDKIKAIFDSAIMEGHEILVLGALGCGCFKWRPKEVACIFSNVLNSDNYKKRFHKIIFAITDISKLEIFEQNIVLN